METTTNTTTRRVSDQQNTVIQNDVPAVEVQRPQPNRVAQQSGTLGKKVSRAGAQSPQQGLRLTDGTRRQGLSIPSTFDRAQRLARPLVNMHGVTAKQSYNAVGDKAEKATAEVMSVAASATKHLAAGVAGVGRGLGFGLFKGASPQSLVMMRALAEAQKGPGVGNIVPAGVCTGERKTPDGTPVATFEFDNPLLEGLSVISLASAQQHECTFGGVHPLTSVVIPLTDEYTNATKAALIVVDHEGYEREAFLYVD